MPDRGQKELTLLRGWGETPERLSLPHVNVICIFLSLPTSVPFLLDIYHDTLPFTTLLS